MRKILAISIPILLVLSSFTNKEKLASYLSEIYSSEKVEEIVANPELAKYYNNVLFNSYSFEKIPSEKPLNPEWEVLTSVNMVNKEKKHSVSSINSLVKALENDYFNILRYQLERNYDTKKTYILGNTRTVLHIKPYTYLTKLQQK
ncbi:MAG: hypothetical protein P8N07_10050 [Flavobacteriales bacterium]|jgi:hypothetical protein|nr:hypothetical protein [Flavobacteriales bacterium]MDG1176122.1 hypothetical protein [Flavobacteriales bacterium]